MDRVMRGINRFLREFKAIVKHPYFGYVFFGMMFLILLLLRNQGMVTISVINTAVIVMIYTVISLGFSLLLGFGGLASLGTAGFVGFGSFLMGYLHGVKDYSLGVTLLLSLCVALAIGLIVGFISLRIEGMYLAIITLGLGEILRQFFISYDIFTGGFSGRSFREFTIFGINFVSGDGRYFNMVYIIVVIMFVLAMIATINIIKSPTGRALLAMKNSDSAAQSMGISLIKYRLLAFILSTVFALLGGMLYIMHTKYSYAPQWNLSFSLEILAAVIVGGAQSIFGIAIGVFLIFGLKISVLNYIPFFQENPALIVIFNGALIILVVMFYPGGLIRLLQTLKYIVVKRFGQLKQKWRRYRYGEDD
ncbi:MAG: branched-chain amino acid ABC transporter permease [Candidatus Izemoplasmatales bacterium]|nr:branched-chain amino acid ABC transporter permease [Candidatus Izemoplasmatales bacterium]